MQGVTQRISRNSAPENPHWNTRFKRYVFADGLSEELKKTFRDAESLVLQADLIKNSRSTTAGSFTVSGQKYFIKRSNINSFSASLRRIGRMTRSERNMLMAAELEKLQIFTPKVYMSLSTGSFFAPGASYLITGFYAGDITARNNLKKMLEYYKTSENLAAGLCALAAFMHNNRIVHHDLKLSNILAVPQDDGSFKLGVFDLDGCCCYRSAAPEWARIKELARLVSSFLIAADELKLISRSAFANEINIWCKAYANNGGKDYSGNRHFMKRLQDYINVYLVDCNI